MLVRLAKHGHLVAYVDPTHSGRLRSTRAGELMMRILRTWGQLADDNDRLRLKNAALRDEALLDKQRVSFSRRAEYEERSRALQTEAILQEVTEVVWCLTDDWYVENCVRPRMLRALGIEGPWEYFA